MPINKITPVLLLDLDGVLNPFAATTCPEGCVEYEFFPGEGPERYCAAHGEWIHELATVGDVWWASTWGADANRLYLAKLATLPDLPVVEFPPLPFPPERKVPAIAAAVGDRPAAWIDGIHTDAGRRWAAERSTLTLLVPTDPSIG